MTNTPDKNVTDAAKRNKYIVDVQDIPHLSAEEKALLQEVTKKYIFRANPYYLSLIDWDDPDDPIRRLVIPQTTERSEWGTLDASNESSVTVTKGVQHKYGSTVLLLVTEVCEAFCRYCFRKRLFQQDNAEANLDISEGLAYIRENEEINNVLLTGGDPLVLATRRLKEILAELAAIDHLRIIRIGTKTPAFRPDRILEDPALLEVLRQYAHSDQRIYFMCHFDHPRELTPQSRQALRMVQDAGAICVNQNPIIRGISDDPEIMAELWNELSYLGVPQYYVFQNRPTEGNEEYAVPIVEAYHAIEEAKRYCSGLAKRAKYVMSHESGKLEIIGVCHKHIYLRYHRAKYSRDESRFLVCHRDDTACWLDELRPVDGYVNEYYQAERKSQVGRFSLSTITNWLAQLL